MQTVQRILLIFFFLLSSFLSFFLPFFLSFLALPSFPSSILFTNLILVDNAKYGVLCLEARADLAIASEPGRDRDLKTEKHGEMKGEKQR